MLGSVEEDDLLKFKDEDVELEEEEDVEDDDEEEFETDSIEGGEFTLFLEACIRARRLCSSWRMSSSVLPLGFVLASSSL